ncbi:P-loop NTPase fold protein [Prosthecochloris sp. ZM]|uniref:KAP family P-loop NTPase fold protein n=1 Tax=Prosthecochloris sp. ZM TaxID=2283143 RepID=UPI00142D398C|nr:P-loop NTPase fold protein [Prosthecochloris sp. ZM]
MSSLSTDHPISTPSDDLLNRSSSVSSFVKQVLGLDPSSGFVVGVLGPWGSGKTSFLNLARLDLEKSGVTVLDFNPWMFSGADHLVELFFAEISAQLKLMPGMNEAGELLESFSGLFADMGWVPFVGPWAERLRLVSEKVGKVLQHKEGGVRELRDKVSAALSKLDKPIVIVLDDIDRLSTNEIREVFKLVRLTASFPNIIYVLAFDRLRVEQALQEQGISGRDYLEKILQVTVDLPVIPEQVLTNQISAVLDQAFAGLEKALPVHEELWPDILLDVIRPLIRNMRDVRRYGLAVRSAMDALDGQVASEDVCALEAVRLFMPDVFHQLSRSRDAVTTCSGQYMPEQVKHLVDRIDACDAPKEVVSHLLRLLFPPGYKLIDASGYVAADVSTWLKERRVAYVDFFDLYFQRIQNEGVTALSKAEQAVELFAEPERLENFLHSLTCDELRNVLASLESLADDCLASEVVHVSVVLLNLLPNVMTEELPGSFGLTNAYYAGRMVSRFLLSIAGEDEREAAMYKLLDEVMTLSGRLELILRMQSKNQDLQGWLPKEKAERVVGYWRRAVRKKMMHAESDWSKEYALLRVLLVARKFARDDEPEVSVPDDPNFTYALLLSSRGEMSSSLLDRRSVKRTATLLWEQLIEIYGGETLLQKRINALAASGMDDQFGVIALAVLYAEGKAPEDADF